MENEPAEPEKKPEEATPQIFSVNFDTRQQKFSRRTFLEAAALTAAASALTGCDAVQLFGPTATPTATNSPQPSSTPQPTNTPTVTPTPTPAMIVTTILGPDYELRERPDWDAPVMGYLEGDATVFIIGRLSDPQWYKVFVDFENFTNIADSSQPFTIGWVHFDQIAYVPDKDFFSIPIEEIPPTPTPLPNATVNPGDDAIEYEYTDSYGNTETFTLPCGSEIPDGGICSCNCVTMPICSCDVYAVDPPCTCDAQGGSTCSCNMVTYYYPN